MYYQFSSNNTLIRLKFISSGYSIFSIVLPKLTKFEKALLDKMEKTVNVTTAAHYLVLDEWNTHPRNCYAALDNIRRKYEESLRFIGTINQYRGRCALLNERLAIRVKVPEKAKEIPASTP